MNRKKDQKKGHTQDVAEQGANVGLDGEFNELVCFGMIIRQFGYRAMEAAGAVQAQRKVKLRPDIHLLLMDLSRLQTEDLQLALWFRVMYPSLKVLVASESVWDINYHLGAHEQIVFLPKPFTAFELARIVRQTLD